METKQFKESLESNVELVARQFAAEKMGLKNDPNGDNLPVELWSQMIKPARVWLNLD